MSAAGTVLRWVLVDDQDRPQPAEHLSYTAAVVEAAHRRDHFGERWAVVERTYHSGPGGALVLDEEDTLVWAADQGGVILSWPPADPGAPWLRLSASAPWAGIR